MKSPSGELVNGFHKHGKWFGYTSDGYNRFSDNEIYLSKNTVRRMWSGNPEARETLFHEWFHARDYYTGWADYFYKSYNPAVYGNAYRNILESRAHFFNYSRYSSPSILSSLQYYNSLIRWLYPVFGF